MNTDLVPSVSITNLLQQRDAIIERLVQVKALLNEAADIAEKSGISDETKYEPFAKLVGEGGQGYRYVLPLTTDESLQSARARLDNAAWDFLLRQSGLVSFMDSTAREEWRKAIERGEAPELNVDNIKATFGRMYEDRGEMFERGVVRCFKQLSWNWKCHLPQKFGRRIHTRIRHWGSVSQEHVDPLEDLERVFCRVDGIPQDDHRSALYERLKAAEAIPGEPYRRRDRFVHDDRYLHFRAFKNGNAAITFKRPDLVDQLNLIIARHFPGCLPAPKELNRTPA